MVVPVQESGSGSSGELTIDVRRGPEDARVLRMRGELDIAVAPDLLPRVPELVSGVPGLVLDLTAVTFFDSAGVRLVDRFARECGRDGIAFAVVAAPGTPPARVLEIVGFGPPLVATDLDAALAAVTDPA
jgi:anti-sigma B factor antagonist